MIAVYLATKRAVSVHLVDPTGLSMRMALTELRTLCGRVPATKYPGGKDAVPASAWCTVCRRRGNYAVDHRSRAGHGGITS